MIPVYNEETDLPGCVRRLHAHLTRAFPYTFRITVADNASTDRTLAVAHELAHELPRVRVVHLPQKGRGRALAAVWLGRSRRAAVRFSDAQCGFKAVRRDAAQQLLPLVEDTGWFFDTELLVLAERAGCGSTRSPSTGWTTRTAASTSSPPRSPTSRASPVCSAAWRAAASRSTGSAHASAASTRRLSRLRSAPCQTGTPSS